ncbi:MAG: M48 family metallopeptidase [Bacteroidota bacterium]
MKKTNHQSTTTNKQNISSIIRQRINPKERFYFGILFAIGLIISIFFLLSWTSILLGVVTAANLSKPFFYLICCIILSVLIPYLFVKLVQTLLMGMVRGNSIKVTAKQFPTVHAMIQKQSEALGMTTPPTGYILNGNGILQALAFRYLRGNYVVLYSDLVAVAKKDESVLAFIIGHELAHIKLNHVSMKKNMLLFTIPILYSAYSRAREYSCDAIGQYLAPEGAEKGMLLLAAGKHLFQGIDLQEYRKNALSDRGFATWWSELFMTHPHLSNRLEAIHQWSKKSK